MIARYGAFVLRQLERFVCLGARYCDAPFYDTRQFDWVALLESRSGEIREEATGILSQFSALMSLSKLSKYQANVDSDDMWKVFLLRGYGHVAKAATLLCPKTLAALDCVPGLGAAMFSILHPHKKIAPHRGLYKGLARYHLALIVPAKGEDCWIRVRDETRNWVPGRSLVFEDTFVHEVSNNTDDFRVVLLVTFERPLRWPFSALNRGLLWIVSRSGYVTDTLARHSRWEEKFLADLEAGKGVCLGE
ncbi:MAG: aspartyl/asparaginyl beta-hydroxylase domain-containing protein [Acidobacteriota bacterium]|nr:aspartyl/asparaginyl beta-hydroxylase domain-containing protein [Acidobacteriota bacterium]